MKNNLKNMKSRQSGSVLVVVIILVIIALLGWGIIFKMQKNDTAPIETIKSAENSNNDSVSAANKTSNTAPSGSQSTSPAVSASDAAQRRDKLALRYELMGHYLKVYVDEIETQALYLNEEQVASMSLNRVQAFLLDKDVNFDGYADVGILSGSGYGGVNNFYDFYIFIPSTKKLEKNEILVDVQPTKIDPVKKQIISTYKSGPGYETVTYQWDGKTFIKSGPISEN